MQSYKFILAIVFFSTAFAEPSTSASVRLPQRHQDWFTGPFSFTKHEYQTFAVFQTNEGRERFIGRFLKTQDCGDLPSYLSAVLTSGVRLERGTSPLQPKVKDGETDTPKRVAIHQCERALCWLAQDRPSKAVTRLEASLFKISQNSVTDLGAVAALYARAGQKAKTFN